MKEQTPPRIKRIGLILEIQLFLTWLVVRVSAALRNRTPSAYGPPVCDFCDGDLWAGWHHVSGGHRPIALCIPCADDLVRVPVPGFTVDPIRRLP